MNKIILKIVTQKLKSLSQKQKLILIFSGMMPLLGYVIVKVISQLILNRIQLKLKSLYFYNFGQSSFLAQMSAQMLNIPSWISCLVKFSQPASMTASQDPNDDMSRNERNGTLATLCLHPTSIPFGSGEDFNLNQSDVQVQVLNNEGFSEFTKSLVLLEGSKFDLQCCVNLYLLDLFPIYSLRFNPRDLFINGMQGLNENIITQLTVIKGTQRELTIDAAFDLYNPSILQFSLGKVMLNLHLGNDFYNLDDESDNESENISEVEYQYGPVVGSVIIENLDLKSGWNSFQAKVFFHPPPNHLPSARLLSNFIDNEQSNIILAGSSQSLLDHPQSLSYLSPVLSSLAIPSVMPGIGDDDRNLIQKCKLKIWNTIKNPVSNLIGRGLSAFGTIDSQVIMSHPFHDKVSIIWVKGDLFLSQQQIQLNEIDQDNSLSDQLRSQSAMSRSTNSNITSTSNRLSQLKPGMKIGSIDLDVRRDRWIQNKSGIEKIIKSNYVNKKSIFSAQGKVQSRLSTLSMTDGYETANSEPDEASLESVISIPPFQTILSPSLPVTISVNPSAISALMSAAVGNLTVDMKLTIGCYIGQYYTENIEISQINVPVDIE